MSVWVGRAEANSFVCCGNGIRDERVARDETRKTDAGSELNEEKTGSNGEDCNQKSNQPQLNAVHAE